MIIKNNDDWKKIILKSIANTERVSQWDPQNRVVRKLKRSMFGGGRRGLRSVLVFPGLTGCRGSRRGLCSQIPWAFQKGYPMLCPLLFGTCSDFCPIRDPTVPEMLQSGILRKPRSGVQYKRNIAALGFESLTWGFSGTVRASPGRGWSEAAGATPTPLPSLAHAVGTPSPLSTRWHS